jgi:hypothetical protein
VILSWKINCFCLTLIQSVIRGVVFRFLAGVKDLHLEPRLFWEPPASCLACKEDPSLEIRRPGNKAGFPAHLIPKLTLCEVIYRRSHAIVACAGTTWPLCSSFQFKMFLIIILYNGIEVGRSFTCLLHKMFTIIVQVDWKLHT